MVIVLFKMFASTLGIMSLRMEHNVMAVKNCYFRIQFDINNSRAVGVMKVKYMKIDVGHF